jgi:FAD/FMN-containing dehydrogenase
MKISSWGNREEHDLEVCDADKVFDIVNREYIPVGNFRSYGDQAVSEGSIAILSTNRNKILDFNPEKGQIRVEAGALLRDVQYFSRSMGWMLPVLPGTQFVTVGGSIANDVHGKNHHQFGSFGEWIEEINIVRSDSGYQTLSKRVNQELFYATIGGCGLTGLILDATINLVPDRGNMVFEERIRFNSIEEFLSLSQDSFEWESSVGWLNLFDKQKGVFLRGRRFKDAKNRAREIDIIFPPWRGPSLINYHTTKLISYLYDRHIMSNKSEKVIESKHFFPLDRIRSWNRAYGRNGFYQYQFVLPLKTASQGCNEILNRIRSHKQGSFLTVIKAFGNRKSGGLLSFPTEGITLAIDFPDFGIKTESLFAELDYLVEKYSGRLYLAKDARMSRKMFENTYQNFAKFGELRDPKISSKLSKRLMGY